MSIDYWRFGRLHKKKKQTQLKQDQCELRTVRTID